MTANIISEQQYTNSKYHRGDLVCDFDVKLHNLGTCLSSTRKHQQSLPCASLDISFLKWIKNTKMTETPKFGKVINLEGINSNLYYAVTRKYNEQSNKTVLSSGKFVVKVSAWKDEGGKKACALLMWANACLCMFWTAGPCMYVCDLFFAIRVACKYVLLSHHGQLRFLLYAAFEFMGLHVCATPCV